MSRRHAYSLLATLIFVGELLAVEVAVEAVSIYTLVFETHLGEPHYTPIDTTQSDTVYAFINDENSVWTNQWKFLLFHLPTTAAACDCLYLEVTAIDLTLDPWHGRTGIGMSLFPQDSSDTTEFRFVPNANWGYYYTYDSLEYGRTYVHRTYRGLDTYFAYTLNRDYPECRELIMAVSPAVTGDTHYIISSTLHWFTQALAVGPEPRVHQDKMSFSVFPNPFVDSFIYSGPRSRYRIFNVLGQEVQSGFVERMSRIDLQRFPAGSYFFQAVGWTNFPLVTIRKVE